MKNILISGFFLLLIAGCDTSNILVEQTSRELAKGVVNSAVQQQFPGVNATPYTNCIIDNSSTDELFRLAQSALDRTSDAAVSLVLEIASRPATSQCIAQNALGSILG